MLIITLEIFILNILNKIFINVGICYKYLTLYTLLRCLYKTILNVCSTRF